MIRYRGKQTREPLRKASANTQPVPKKFLSYAQVTNYTVQTPPKAGLNLPDEQPPTLTQPAEATSTTSNDPTPTNPKIPDDISEEETDEDDYLVERELELAAYLETQGITDAVAVSRGASDVFELAHQLRLKGETPISSSPPETQSADSNQLTTASNKLLSTLMCGPLTLVIIVLMMLGIKLFQNAFTDIGAPPWTLPLGMTMGMVLASAAMQVLGWRLSMISDTKNKAGIRFILLTGLVLFLGLALLLTLILLGFGFWLETPTSGMIALGVGCVGMVLLMLLNGSLALLGSSLLAGGLLILTFGFIALAHHLWLAEYGLFPTLIGGYLLVCATLGAALVIKLQSTRSRFWIFPHSGAGDFGFWIIVSVRRWTTQNHLPTNGGKSKTQAKDKDKDKDKKEKEKEGTTFYLPPKGQLFYKALPYLSYGTLSVIYVLVGQLCGWFGILPKEWSRDKAITALNIVHILGLMTLVLTQGVTEVTLKRFWKTMFKAQREVAFNDHSAIAQLVWGFIHRYLRSLLLSQFLTALTLVGLAMWGWQQFGLDLVFGPLLPHLLLGVMVGYSLLAWGLFECGLLLTLAQPWRAALALLIATSVQLVSGLTLSWVSGFEASVISTIIGGICLVLFAHRGLSRLLSPVSYGLYQAF